MNKQEHYQILSSELANRDAFWKNKIQEIKKEYEEKINSITKSHEDSFEGQLGKLITNMVKQTIKEEEMNHLKVDIETNYDPYSDSDEHDHQISIQWCK